MFFFHFFLYYINKGPHTCTRSTFRASFIWARAWQRQPNLCTQRTQNNLAIRPVRLESLPCAEFCTGDSCSIYVLAEDSDQTKRVPSLIRVSAGRSDHFLDFVTQCLSFNNKKTPQINMTSTLFFQESNSFNSMIY